jgi:2-polyprenyl-6-methoxyphenol hydroxylase-like FAD-dependent oxidoreductase
MAQLTPRHHAVVLGASLGGLLTARVLSQHYDRVTILEKDRVNHYPESRPGQPHTRHLHALLATGLDAMSHYFPDLPQALIDHGAMVNDFAGSMRWYIYGGYRERFTIGFPATTLSRGLLEYLVRDRVLTLDNIELRDQTIVHQLITTADRSQVIGVQVNQPGQLATTTDMMADLVVDVTGRNSPSPRWLKALGYEAAPEQKVTVNVSYATRIYRRDPKDLRSQTWILSSPEPPQEKRFGGIFAIEDDRWIVSVGSWHEDDPPIEEAQFLAFARSLPSPDIYDIVSHAEPLSGIIPHKFPFSLWRHYERLSRFPSGYLVLGDAVASFNPTYGQGMTVAALETIELDRLLTGNISPDRLAQRFFQQVATVVSIPWQLAISQDFCYPQTVGDKPRGTDLMNRYIALVHRATLRDRVVGEVFFRVMNLMVPPVSLLHPRIVWRVWREWVRADR